MDDTDALQAQIAAKFRAWRTYQGMSQADVSAALREQGVNLHPSAIAKMERGERRIDLPTAMRLCDVLSLPWASLYEDRLNPRERLRTVMYDLDRSLRDRIDQLVKVNQFEGAVEATIDDFTRLVDMLDDDPDMTPDAVAEITDSMRLLLRADYEVTSGVSQLAGLLRDAADDIRHTFMTIDEGRADGSA